MVRPEEVHVGTAEGIEATVVRASFVGSSALYQLSCAGDQLLATVAMERGVPLHADGAAVHLAVRDEALRAFARAG